MTEATHRTTSLIEYGRSLRRAWDALSPGDRAALRRCATPHEAQLEGAFWRLVRDIPPGLRERAAVMTVCFPACDATESEAFRLGTFLRDGLVKGESQGNADALRFRQLVASRSDEELAHRLRRLLQHIDRAVDWGVVFRDLMQWTKDDDARGRVCRRWARDFYTPSASDDDTDDSTP